MANLLARLTGRPDETRYSIDQWLSDYLIPSQQQFVYGGNVYGLRQTYDGQPIEKVADHLPAYAQALQGCPPAFAAEMVRALVISQARFTFRNQPGAPGGNTPRKVFGTTALSILETPWVNGTTGELLARMEWHAGLGGNSYVTRRGNELKVLRPDWVGILYGSQLEPDDPQHALDGRVVGYVYQQGGIHAGNQHRIETLLPDEVAHWSPIPDPESPGLGMSWITPAVREIQGDRAATEHKLKFFANGATPNLVVKGIPAMTNDSFNEIVDMMETRHRGVANAYRTLYLSEGVDATVVGSNLQQLDFKATQGAGETRISVLSRVPAPLLGISEGLAGSSLNAGNFGMARRMFADTWVYPTLQDVASALAPLIDVPQYAELWPDTTDIPLLREDGKDAADIEQTKASTIRTLIDAGFEPKTVVDAVQSQNMSLLRHTGLFSIQLQEPGSPKLPQPGPDLAAVGQGNGKPPPGQPIPPKPVPARPAPTGAP